MIHSLKEQRAFERKSRKDWLQSLADTGKTLPDAAALVDCSVAGLWSACSHYGVKGFAPVVRSKKPKRTELPFLKNLRLLCASGNLTISQIASKTGRSNNCIRYYITTYSLPFKPAEIGRPMGARPVPPVASPAMSEAVKRVIEGKARNLTAAEIVGFSGLPMHRITFLLGRMQ